MCNAPLKEPVLGLFEMAMKKVNKALEATDITCKHIWESNCKKCKMRKPDPPFKAILCKYPGRLNYVNKDNCTFGSCPFVHRR